VIVGIGVDVCDVARFEESLRRTPALAGKLFTSAEQDRPAATASASLAARFAAKEALAKALGAPDGLEWHDAEVVSEPSGRPVLVLRGTVRAVADRLGVRDVHVTLSHDAGVATAVVVLEA
jgi:holo-[acyl-carrier protein] synthase